MPAFPQAAADSTQDAPLRGNLRHATHTIRDKRAKAVAELDDWAELREAGAAIKDRTPAPSRPLSRAGRRRRSRRPAAHVHWAADADEANRIVTGLVQETGETRGRQGQVDGHPGDRPQRGAGRRRASPPTRPTWPSSSCSSATTCPRTSSSRPSTATAPRSATSSDARWADWGRPAPEGLTDDPADLAEAARLHLREKFLRAKVGISGANFMVAETGTLVVVESEGNGRMCLTLPETLISVVGIEKIVPDLAGPGGLPPDAAAVLHRRADEPVHLDLDRHHGRRRPAGPSTSCCSTTAAPTPSPTRSAARRCAASAARPASTSARSTNAPAATPTAPPIPARSAPSSPRSCAARQTELDASLPYASSLCGACYEVCPVAIDIPEVLVHLRERVVEGGTVTVRGAAADAQARQGPRRRTGGHACGPLGLRPAGGAARRAAARRPHPAPRTRSGSPGPGRAWTDTRDIPAVPAESFRDWWHRTRPRKETDEVSSRETRAGPGAPRPGRCAEGGAAAGCRRAPRLSAGARRAAPPRRPWICSPRTWLTTARSSTAARPSGAARADRRAAHGACRRTRRWYPADCPPRGRRTSPRRSSGTTRRPPHGTGRRGQRGDGVRGGRRRDRHDRAGRRARTRGGAGSRSSPTTTSAWYGRPDQVVGSVGEAPGTARPDPSADLDLRPVGHQRHRTRPGGGCPRTAHPRGGAPGRLMPGPAGAGTVHTARAGSPSHPVVWAPGTGVSPRPPPWPTRGRHGTTIIAIKKIFFTNSTTYRTAPHIADR